MKEVKKLLTICLNSNGRLDNEKFKVVVEYLRDNKPSLLVSFKAELKKYLNLNTLKVTSSYELTHNQKSELERKFNAGFYEYVVDKNVLGGLVIQYADTVYDNSLAAKINQIN